MKKGIALLAGLLGALALAQPVEVEFLHAMGAGSPLGDTLQALIDDYNASQDEVLIRPVDGGGYDEVLQETLAKLAAGDTPDLVQLDGYMVARVADSGQLLDLGPRLRGEYRALWTDLYPAFRSQVVEDSGAVHALPFNNSVFVLYYNPAMFEQAGVKPPETYTEFAEVAARLTEVTGKPAFALKTSATIFEQGVWSNGGEMADENGLNLNEPEAVEVVQFWDDQIDEGTTVLGGGGDQLQQDFATGNVAMFGDTIVRSIFMKDVVPFEYGIAPLPYFDQPVTPVGGASLAIFNTIPAERQAAAWDFLVWLTEPEQQVTWVQGTNYVPVRQSAVETPAYRELARISPAARVAAEVLPTARSRPSYAGYPQATDEMVAMLERIFLQDTPVQETLATLVQQTARLFR